MAKSLHWGYTSLSNRAFLNDNWREIVLVRGHCRKNCNFDYLNRLTFRIFFKAFKSQALKFCTRSQLTWRDFFSQLSSILIVAFCTCYTEPHLILTCPRSSQNTKHYRYDRRLISPETNLAHYTENFVFSVLYKGPILPQTSVQRLAHSRNVTTCCFCSHLL